MGAEEIALPAQLVRTTSGDEVHLNDGQILKLSAPLGCADHQELVVVVLAKPYYQTNKQELAKQLLQEIIKG
ncbi:MAG: hypothetical protein WC553_02910 [Patescibacteria group bacterium]|jgi:hypothetical protein